MFLILSFANKYINNNVLMSIHFLGLSDEVAQPQPRDLHAVRKVRVEAAVDDQGRGLRHRGAQGEAG